MGRVGRRARFDAVAATAVASVFIANIASCSRTPRAAIEEEGVLATGIAEVEAGRRTTPLIVQPAAGGDARVTFLVESPDGRVPRIVSDVTGWGENMADDTFDTDAGRMARVGSGDWYRLEVQVVSGACVEYLVVLGGTDYRLDPNNPRRSDPRFGDPHSEFVTPGYVPPREFTDPPTSPAGVVVETAIDSHALGGSRRVVV